MSREKILRIKKTEEIEDKWCSWFKSGHNKCLCQDCFESHENRICAYGQKGKGPEGIVEKCVCIFEK